MILKFVHALRKFNIAPKSCLPNRKLVFQPPCFRGYRAMLNFGGVFIPNVASKTTWKSHDLVRLRVLQKHKGDYSDHATCKPIVHDLFQHCLVQNNG